MSYLSEEEVELVEETLQRIASDLSMIADRQLELNSVKVKRSTKRAVGRDRIHISFKLGIKTEEGILHGCVLVPLPDAISLACYLMMVPDEGVVAKRADQTARAPHLNPSQHRLFAFAIAARNQFRPRQ